MSLYIKYQDISLKKKAGELSELLHLKIFAEPENIKERNFSEDYFLVLNSENMFLQKGLNRNTNPIFSDFDNWAANYEDKLLQKSLRGLPNNFSCVDLTAGFGKDAFEIAKSRKCKSIHLIEKEKWVFSLLEDGLKNSGTKEAKELLLKFQIFNEDNLQFLETNKKKYDLIFIDPMFTGVQKSKAKRHMQALRDLSSSINDENLLKRSLERANLKVIVKRHKNMAFLEEVLPSRSIEGKVVRYDIYNTN